MEDPTDVGAFLRALRGPDELHHLVTIDPDGKGPGNVTGRKHAADHDDGIAKFIARENNERCRNVYFTLNRVKGNPKRSKAKKSDISAVLGYGIDIDPPASCADLSAWRERKASELRESGQPPTTIWCSGNGIQAVWMLREPVPIESEHDWPKHEAINAALAQKFGGDATQNIDRLFRLPGTTNYPNAKKRANKRVATQAHAIEGPNDRRYAPDDFAELVADTDVATVAASPTASASDVTGDPGELMAQLPESLWQDIQTPVPEGRRSQAVCKVVRSAFEYGLSPDEIEAVLSEHPHGVAAKYAQRGDLRAEINRQWQKWQTRSHNRYRYTDFLAHPPTGRYIRIQDGQFWPKHSVDAQLPAVETGAIDPKTNKPVKIRASTWIDRNQAVDGITWLPGAPPVIPDVMFREGGRIEHPGYRVFNMYRPPRIEPGDAAKAGPWLEHLRYVYPDDADHIIKWLAHRVQRPGEKINHALVLYGLQGIGKDTLLAPVIDAVGPWNVATIAPDAILGNFNWFVQSVILLINEGADLGDVNRYTFYERLKAATAAPPDVLMCNQKHMQAFAVPNITSVIITTNYKQHGLFLLHDDRRHYIASSDRDKSDFSEGYWQELHDWYDHGGKAHVAAYLAEHDLSTFNAKAPPPKTEAFWSIVDAHRAPEDAELADTLDKLEWPDALTLDDVRKAATSLSMHGFEEWLANRSNRRKTSHRMEAAGYEPVRNPDAKDGLWKYRGKRQVVHAKRSLSYHDRLGAAARLVGDSRWCQ